MARSGKPFLGPHNRRRAAMLRQGGHRYAMKGGGLLFGMVGYALTVAYMQGGWSGVKAWGAAKLVNKPTQGAAAPGAGGDAQGGGGGGFDRPSSLVVGG